MRYAAALALCATCFFAAGPPAMAQADPGAQEPINPQYYRVYGYDTPLRGWAEPNLLETVVPTSSSGTLNGSTTHTFELEYGATNHVAVGGYLDFTSGSNQTLRLAQSRLLTYFHFKERYEEPWNFAGYAEYYFPAAYLSGQHLELRGILDRDFNDYRVELNPIAEFGTSGPIAGKSPVLGINAGAYYRKSFAVQPGIEVFASFGELSTAANAGDLRLTVFPAVTFLLGRPSRGGTFMWQVGPGFGLTNASDRFTLKSYFTYEFNAVRPTHQPW